MMIAACWAIPLLFLLPSVVKVYGIHGLECLSRSCTILKDSKGHSAKNFLFAFGFGLPTLVLILTNTSIYCKVKVITNLFFKINDNYMIRNYWHQYDSECLNRYFIQNMRKTMEKEMRKSKIRIPTALKDKEQRTFCLFED